MRFCWPLAAVLVLIGCGRPKAADADEEVKPIAVVTLARVTKRPIRELINVSGTLVPSPGTSAKLTPAMAGRIAQVLVKEGQTVTRGELLAVLDLSVQRGQLRSAAEAAKAAGDAADQSLLAYQGAQADQSATVATAEITLQQAIDQRETDMTQAELTLRQTLADLAKTRAGARPQEISEAHEASEQARVSAARARSQYDRDASLWPAGLVARRQLEEDKTTMDAADSALRAAEANESLVRAGARTEDIRASEARAAAARDAWRSARLLGDAKVASAKALLKQARASALLVKAKLADVASNRALFAQKQADLASAGAATALGEIRAPFNGKVARVYLNRGDTADTTTTVIEVVALSAHDDFVANVLPSQLSDVAVGQAAEIDTGNQPVAGRVVSISPGDLQTGLAAVRIICSARGETGLVAVAHIVLRRIPDAVAVPDSALLSRDGKTIVLKDEEGVAKETEVETGPSDAGFTEIKNGLKLDDQVVSEGGYALDDGTKITTAPPKDGADDKKESGA